MPGQATVTIDENQWNVSLATTYAELTKGLGGVASIPAGTGMLFVLPSEQTVSVTTQSMQFNIDVIFISSDLKVVDVARDVAPGYTMTESTPVKYFLEVSASEAAAVEVGDTVKIELLFTILDNITPVVAFAIPLLALGFVSTMVGGMVRAMIGSSHSSYPSLQESAEKARRCARCGKTKDVKYRPGTGLWLCDECFKLWFEIAGGEPIPPQYRYLVGWLDEPLPEYSLMTELVPGPEAAVGERKVDTLLRQLKDGVENIQQSEQFHLFLTTMAKFHDYSIGNQILIMVQKRDATHVAGFNTWKDLGRWVKRGERGIAILAPVLPPRPTCPECGAKIPRGAKFCPQCGRSAEEIEVEVEPRYFKVVYVFDISQTEGKPLPEFEVPVLTGEVNEELFSKAMALTKGQGLTVSFESRPHQDPSIKGEYFGKSIWIRPEEPRSQQLKSLLHEVAHYYSEGVFRMPRRDAETIAESAAFVIGAHFGFDTGVRSFPYVALWAQDKKVLEQNLAAIRRVATSIIEALERASLPTVLAGHHSMWLNLEQRKEMEKKYGTVAVRWAEEATRPGDVKAAERAAEYYYNKVKEVLGLGHLSPELTEDQIMKLREVLGLPVDLDEVLKIHQKTGYVP